MIPMGNITAWGNIAPWAELRQIEQDLIICRALVELFSDDFLKNELRFRGGTALNKLHFPKAIRYSEDIDLVRTTAGPIGPILNRIRADPRTMAWPGEFRAKQSRAEAMVQDKSRRPGGDGANTPEGGNQYGGTRGLRHAANHPLSYQQPMVFWQS